MDSVGRRFDAICGTFHCAAALVGTVAVALATDPDPSVAPERYLWVGVANAAGFLPICLCLSFPCSAAWNRWLKQSSTRLLWRGEWDSWWWRRGSCLYGDPSPVRDGFLQEWGRFIYRFERTPTVGCLVMETALWKLSARFPAVFRAHIGNTRASSAPLSFHCVRRV